MYRYDAIDRRLVFERVAQFRDQTRRHLAGELSDDQFRPLRLQNGLYVEKHGPMLRIAIPYGQLSAKQLRTLARVARVYDRGVGHFTTRHNLQLNWVRLDQAPDILAELAKADLHAIQTSGSCIRNVTTDALAGVAPAEVADPRPWAEILRQWSTLHPEFAHLPRKFKIAVSGGPDDAAGTRVHDLGLQLVRDAAGELGFKVWVGGGLGRTPVLGQALRDFLPWRHLLSYAEAILRTYNLAGRRDKLYKSRLKILVQAVGIAEFRRRVEAEWAHLVDGPATLTGEEVDRIAGHFAPPDYQTLPELDASYEFVRRHEPDFAAWAARHVHGHRVPGYAAVTLALKAPGASPGDATAAQMEAAADLAERFGFGELRISQRQNLVLPDVRKRDLAALWRAAGAAGLAATAAGLATDLTVCPGADFCSLASARTLPVAAALQQRLAAGAADIGELRLNISGCVNACGHHHVGHVGLLGVAKGGSEHYQITLGGAWGMEAAFGPRIGAVIGPAIPAQEVPAAVDRMVDVYRSCRRHHERFIDTLHRLGPEAFRAAAYDEETPDYEREAANG